MKVVKFGGSSLASATQFKKVHDIVLEDTDRHYVVPSAPGKRNKEDTKVTDLLILAYSHHNKDDFEETIHSVMGDDNAVNILLKALSEKDVLFKPSLDIRLLDSLYLAKK